MIKSIDIYWRDLTEKKQKEIETILGESMESWNWDVFPVTSIDVEIDEEKED